MTAAVMRVRRTVREVRPVAGEIAGLGLFTAAGFTINLTVGCVVAGISCFVLNWMARP